MKLRFLLVLLIPVLGLAQVGLAVASSKKTTQTGKSTYGAGTSATLATTDYVDRVTLNLTLNGNASVNVACYFVARDTRTHALSYHGFESVPAQLAGRKSLSVESQPAVYSRRKSQRATAEDERGQMPFGWVVIVSAGKNEVAAKASSPDVMKWVRDNPPKKPNKYSP